MNDKKKTLVIAGLAVVLVGVGAFQFLPKGGGGTDSAATTAKPASTSTGSGKPTGKEAPTTSQASEPTKGGTSESGSKPADKAAEKEMDPQKAMLLAMVKDPLPKRDPFQQQVATTGQTTDPNAYMPEQAPKSTKPAPTYQGPRRSYGGPGISGDVPPVNPLPDGMGNQQGGPVVLQGATPLRQPGEFAYQVKGVIVGKKPMAVFEDDNGNQRLVPLGGSIDGDSTVTGVEKGKVRIRHKGKDKTLRLSEGQ
ncbi:MAG: hypothetical protein JST30_05535 [Armatimonadetes bacterium]|nr:hypothetical protein [Armatimonadota bacterium]